MVRVRTGTARSAAPTTPSPPMPSHSSHARIAPLMVLCLWAAGCVEQPGIRTYTVAKEPKVATSTPGMAWFFKLLGPADEVRAQVEPFGELVRSVEFGRDGSPTWALPAGWSERRETGLRYATLTIESVDPPLEAHVSALPADDPSSADYLKANIDRWRSQVGLPPYDGEWQKQAKADGELAEVENRGRKVTIVHLLGETEQFGSSRMLAAIIPHVDDGDGAPATREPSSATPQQPPSYVVPEGWAKGQPGSFQFAVFNVDAEGRSVEVSVAKAGGSLEDNIARWRGQIGAAPGEGESRPIKVGGHDATFVELSGPRETILGVIVPRGGTNWFFKLKGDPELAVRERSRFDEFVQSVQFAQP